MIALAAINRLRHAAPLPQFQLRRQRPAVTRLRG
jgi:hypothetical protein